MYKILIIFFFSVFVHIVKADDNVIKIAIADSPPFEFYADGKIQGINVKTIEDVFSNAGYSVQFYSLPWKRALMSVESGDVDALATTIKSSKTTSLFILSNPIIYTQYILLKNKSLSIDAKNFSDIEKYVIGTIDEYFYGDNFSSNSSLQLSPITSPTPDVDNLEKLSYQRIDLVACSVHVCGYWIEKYDKIFSNIDFLTNLTISTKNTLHLAFSKNDPKRANEIANKFNAELAKYIAQGNIEKNIALYSANGSINFNNFDRNLLQ